MADVELFVSVFEKDIEIYKIGITESDNSLFDFIRCSETINHTFVETDVGTLLKKEEINLFEFNEVHEELSQTEKIDAALAYEILYKLYRSLRQKKYLAFSKQQKKWEESKNYNEDETREIINNKFLAHIDFDHSCGLLLGILKVAAFKKHTIQILAEWY